MRGAETLFNPFFTKLPPPAHLQYSEPMAVQLSLIVLHITPHSCTAQVRAEERTAAKAALQQAIQHTKTQLEAKYVQEVQQTPETHQQQQGPQI
jgi:hypothetical protein